MNFNIGDKVKLINQNLKGTVIKLAGNEITILNEFDFEEKFDKKELIIDNHFEVSSIESEGKILKEENKVSTINFQKTQKNNLLEVDLHIGHLADNLKSISPHKMLQIQVNKITETLLFARENKYKTLIFIHGKGKGVLKKELDNILDKENGITYFDANFQRYKMGATEVRFK